MGADIKQLKNRIKSIDSTLHITKAMKLVASSKIHRAEEKRKAVLPFSDTVSAAVADMLSGECLKSPFVTVPNKEAPVCYIVIESDRGLAGSFNGNINRMLRDTVNETDSVVPIGKRALDWCRTRIKNIPFSYESSEHISDGDVAALSSFISEKICDGSFSGVKIIYTAFVNVLTQEAKTLQLIPLVPTGKRQSTAIYEPSAEAVLDRAVPLYISSVIHSCIAESILSEQYARRNAMDTASENASDMIDRLSLKYNRARQNTITQEITEIVAGADSGN